MGPLLFLLAANMDATPSPAGSSATSAGSSQPQQPSASAVLRALTTSEPIPKAASGVTRQIDDLLEEQRRIRAQRAQIAKDLRNAQRRRARLKHKARLLSASDLASVLVLRQEEEELRASAASKRRRSSQPDTGGDEALGGDRADEEAPERDASDVGDEHEEAGNTADPPART